MRFDVMQEGQCYVLSHGFANIPSVREDIQKGNLSMPFKTSGGRPFLCVKKDEKNGIVWLAPLSTKYDKYIDISRKKRQKNGYCSDYVFTRFNNRDNVVVMAQLIPVLPSFVHREFIPLQQDAEGAFSNYYPISHRSMQIVKRYFHIKKNAIDRGEVSTYTNVSEHYKFMLENDYRPFYSLNSAERQKIIESMYMTDTLKLNAGKKTEAETLAYAKEYQSLVQELCGWKGTFYNPHNCTFKKQITYKFGTERYSFFKGQRCYYEYTNDILDTLKLSTVLDGLNIPYRGTITFQGKGELRILTADKKAFTDYVKANRESVKTRDVRWLGNIPTKAIVDTDRCARFDGDFPYKLAVVFSSYLAKNNKRFACYFGESGKATLYVYKNDVDEAKNILNRAIRDYNDSLSIAHETTKVTGNYAVAL